MAEKVDPRQLLNILRKCRGRIDSCSLQTCIFIVHAGASVRVFDEVIMTNIHQRCLNNTDQLEELSMADLEYLSRCLCMFNDVNHMETNKLAAFRLLDEIKRRLHDVAHRHFYTNFIRIVRNLTVIDVYNTELLANIMHPDYRNQIHKKSKQLDLPMFELDGYNRINLREIYCGDYLTDTHLEKLRFFIEYIPDRVKRHRKRHLFFYAIEDVIQRLFGKYQIAHAIPWRRLTGEHSSTDLTEKLFIVYYLQLALPFFSYFFVSIILMLNSYFLLRL